MEYGFFRCHNSYIVNIKKIVKMDKEFAYFANGKKAYISVGKYSETRKKYIDVKKLHICR